MLNKFSLSAFTFFAFVMSGAAAHAQTEIVHDAEYYVLEAQNGDRWAAEDEKIDAKLAALEKKHGQPPNIVYLLWDDTAFGSVGFPALQKNFGYETPNLNRMADEGINFTRMYTEPSCTPTRAAFLTGRHPVRIGIKEVKVALVGEGIPISGGVGAEFLERTAVRSVLDRFHQPRDPERPQAARAPAPAAARSPEGASRSSGRWGCPRQGSAAGNADKGRRGCHCEKMYGKGLSHQLHPGQYIAVCTAADN